ncbi:GHKL domain-containing protein [bacterium]|nr:MAG: GHKL domain-containing protein [bacterium]
MGSASQSLVQYDPVKLFSGIFFKHLDLKPFFDGNLLYITNPNTGHVQLIGRKVILVPSELKGIHAHLGNYRDITGPVHDGEIIGTLISETITVRGEPVCEAGIIMEAPYFIINYSFEELVITRMFWNLRSMLIGRNELLQQYFKANDNLRAEIEEKNKAYESIKEYANNLEELVKKRTNQYREQKDKAESLVLDLQVAYKNLQEAQNKLVMQEVAKAEREKELQTEKAMSGGLAHEGRNALMPAAIQIRRLMEYQDKQSAFDILSNKSGSLLNHIIKIENEYGLPQESINKEIIPIFREINDLIKDINKTTEEISMGVGKGLGLIDLFMTYSKTQEMTRGAESIDFSKIANELGETYKKKLSESGIAYTVKVIDNTEAIINGDYLHIESIIKNLFLNALDALEKSEQKKIDITISKIAKDDISYLRITVADTGEGIPEDQRDKIFQAFYTTKSAKGTGLGLSIVKRLVEIYEGSITFESEVVRGTTFMVDLKS